MKNFEDSILNIKATNKQDFLNEIKKIVGDKIQICFCYKDTEIQLLDSENKKIIMVKVSPIGGIFQYLSKKIKYVDIPIKAYDVYTYTI